MRNIHYIFLSLSALIFGILFYAFYNGWIIFYHPTMRQDLSSITASKKQVSLFFMKNNQWQKEQKDLVLAGDMPQALPVIITAWLNIIAEENINKKRPHLEAITVSSTENELFISLDRSPFSRDSSTHDKLVWVEGLLKTIRENEPKIQYVRLLVDHQPLQDRTLDFSASWPIAGFLGA